MNAVLRTCNVPYAGRLRPVKERRLTELEEAENREAGKTLGLGCLLIIVSSFIGSIFLYFITNLLGVI